jgi:hypothetical protein
MRVNPKIDLVDRTINALVPSLKRFVNRVKLVLKQWSKPVTASIVVGALSDLRRNRRDLILENAMLRQQLIVRNRQVTQPQLSQGDRLRLVLLARMTEYWRQALPSSRTHCYAGIATRFVFIGGANRSPRSVSYASHQKPSS